MFHSYCGCYSYTWISLSTPLGEIHLQRQLPHIQVVSPNSHTHQVNILWMTRKCYKQTLRETLKAGTQNCVTEGRHWHLTTRVHLTAGHSELLMLAADRKTSLTKTCSAIRSLRMRKTKTTGFVLLGRKVIVCKWYLWVVVGSVDSSLLLNYSKLNRVADTVQSIHVLTLKSQAGSAAQVLVAVWLPSLSVVTYSTEDKWCDFMLASLTQRKSQSIPEGLF